MSTNSIIEKKISSNINDSASSLRDMIDTMDKSKPSIEQMGKEMNQYDQVIDSDTFYSKISNDVKNMSDKEYSIEDSNVEDFSNSKNKYFPTWCIIIIIFLLLIGCIYFIKMRKEKNKIKAK